MSHFPGDEDATDADLVGTVLLLIGATHYFVVVSRRQDDFSVVVVSTDEGWEHLGTVISGICQRTRLPRKRTSG